MKQPFGFMSAYYKQEDILRNEDKLSADPNERNK